MQEAATCRLTSSYLKKRKQNVEAIDLWRSRPFVALLEKGMVWKVKGLILQKIDRKSVV